MSRLGKTVELIVKLENSLNDEGKDDQKVKINRYDIYCRMTVVLLTVLFFYVLDLALRLIVPHGHDEPARAGLGWCGRGCPAGG